MAHARNFKNSQRSFRVDKVNIVKPNHPAVHALQEQGFRPKNFGCRVWPGSYLMMHYLRSSPLKAGAKVLELGAGWGVLSTYVSRHFEAKATALDIDTQVLPYQKLIADLNRVNITSLTSSFEDILPETIKPFDYVLGSDICYSQTIKNQLKRLLESGLHASENHQSHPSHKKTRFIISDTGRKPFMELTEELAEHFPQHSVTRVTTELPTQSHGYVLEVPISC